MKLVIVESPAKGKTIEKFLGKDFKVLASFGHVRDLPKRELGVDVDKEFEPKYVIPPKARKTISELKKQSSKAEATILATDEDREGESIAWHLAQALGLGKFEIRNSKSETNSKSEKSKPYSRIVFHEITKDAIQKAMENPRDIDINMVNAQQARRILDRLVGYKLSPFLWKKVTKGLSAGRVQSVAVRLVVEREREVQNFKPVEYWSVEALLKKSKEEFTAQLYKQGGKTIEKLEIKNKEDADKILADLHGADYIVESVEKKETNRYPAPPFTTSTLQQASWQKLHYSAKMTMSLAQKLYESGLITYHRTDSLNLSDMSLQAAKKFISENIGPNYWAGKVVKYKTKKAGAQEAHEAIRPAYADKTPETLNGLDPRQLKLYTLIWQRFVACQMAPAVFNSVSADIKAGEFNFKATGQTLKFDGFLKIYQSKFEEKNIPDLQEADMLELSKIEALQHFTEPPPRYNEASLIKTLEKFGIGRPSTYAPTLATIQDRRYVEKNEQKRFIPTEIGTVVNDILVQNFPEIVDIDFTAKMEQELDEVAEGKDSWQKTCKDFYAPFSKKLEEKYQEVKKSDLIKETDKICPECGSAIIERFGRFGKFYACSKFPECKHTESVKDEKTDIGVKCPKCKEGDMIQRKTKRGKLFYGCSRFPKCDFATWDKPFVSAQGKPEFCPKCDSILTETKKGQIKCSNKECDYTKEK